MKMTDIEKARVTNMATMVRRGKLGRPQMAYVIATNVRYGAQSPEARGNLVAVMTRDFLDTTWSLNFVSATDVRSTWNDHLVVDAQERARTAERGAAFAAELAELRTQETQLASARVQLAAALGRESVGSLRHGSKLELSLEEVEALLSALAH